MTTCALLTAAGVGSRMGQEVPKQFLHVNDKPILVYTLERFQRNPQIDAIAVVTLPHWVDFVWAYARQSGIAKLRWVVPGGATGQDSIYNGLKAVAEACDPAQTIMMIHDGNRPMVGDDLISDSLAVFQEYGCAVAAIPCTEVVFRSADSRCGRTQIPREELWRTQTPHTYTLEKLLWAHAKSAELGLEKTAATCQLMALLGEAVYFSRGSEKNLKLTTIDDIDIFKALLNTTRSAWQNP